MTQQEKEYVKFLRQSCKKPNGLVKNLIKNKISYLTLGTNYIVIRTEDKPLAEVMGYKVIHTVYKKISLAKRKSKKVFTWRVAGMDFAESLN
jgi:hypothetical protein